MLDFDKLLEPGQGSEAFKGCDVGFCALGTTRGKSGVVRWRESGWVAGSSWVGVCGGGGI